MQIPINKWEPEEALQMITRLHNLQTQISDPELHQQLSKRIQELNLIAQTIQSSERSAFKSNAVLGKKGPLGA